MKELKLSNVLKNSQSAMGFDASKINESTGTSDIATFAAQVDILIKEKFKTSLAYELADVQPLATPVGNVFSLTKVNTSGNSWKFKVINTPVTAVTKYADTGFTNEAWQDLQAQFGEDANDICANVLSKVSADVETHDFLTFVKNNSKVMPALVAQSYEHVFTTIGNAIVSMNQITFRTMKAWVILPSAIAGNFIADPNYFISDALDTKSQYLIYKFGNTKFYINHDNTDQNVYVGLNGDEPGTSSIIFSPYQYTISPATNPDSGQNTLFVFNRYAITLNPLSVPGNEMLYSFALTMPFTV
jgi:hypothetical protein